MKNFLGRLELFIKDFPKIIHRNFFIYYSRFPEEELEAWDIGLTNESSYRNIDSFINEVNCDDISFLINRAMSDACDSRKMEYIISNYA